MGPVKEGTGMKTITLTRPRLVQSQLNPAHYTTGERCCAHFATQPTKTTTTASIEAGPSASYRQFKALTPMTPLPVQSRAANPL